MGDPTVNALVVYTAWLIDHWNTERLDANDAGKVVQDFIQNHQGASNLVELRDVLLPEDDKEVLVFCEENKCHYTAYVRGGVWYHFHGTDRLEYEVTSWRAIKRSEITA